MRARFRAPRYALGAAVAGSLYGPEKQQSSLYSPPSQETVLVEDHSPLEAQIGQVRRQATELYKEGYSKVQGLVNQWINLEGKVENRLKALKAPEETLTPQILYISVLTLSSTLLTAHLSRFAPRRFLLPPAVFLASSYYYLPKTSTNVYEYGKSLESDRVRRFHDTAIAHSKMSIDRLSDGWSDAKESLVKGLDWTVNNVQDSTGLKVKEALGRSEQVKQSVSESVKAAVEEGKEKLDQAKDKVENKVEELKGKAEKKADEPPKRLV